MNKTLRRTVGRLRLHLTLVKGAIRSAWSRFDGPTPRHIATETLWDDWRCLQFRRERALDKIARASATQSLADVINEV